MSDSIQIKKLKMMMYRVLRWRLQVPDYADHNPIPLDSKLSEFSRGVKCAYRDLLSEIENIEKSENQFKLWRKRKGDLPYDESFMEEIKRY